ncbi:PIG-L deacetylase family protein [Paenibacillus sp. 1001270B_150601_E10]|uniref:PIG-L deacetylase family protein n=1 Tax=Paenibacillus sp. 1001270B_150601_E10 TaxID=2787079 RepID=UPI001E4AADE6|nr:PIG-L deacetylase family protein [Paenibacillus sp. 1001270B_150601_E10]
MIHQELSILVIGAHPDEPDIYAGGIAAWFAEQGARVQFLTLTDGRCGHYKESGAALIERRRHEAEIARQQLGIEAYTVLDTPDGELLPSIEVRQEVIRNICRAKADIVITFHPEGCAHADNRYTGVVVRDAASFIARTPNAVPEVPTLPQSPVFLLMPDYSMKPTYRADVAIDIGSVLGKKLQAWHAHASQFYEFAPWQMGILNQVPDEVEGRMEFLRQYWGSYIHVSEEMKPALKKFYGEEKASQIRYAECFEIANYGRRPSDEEWREWLGISLNK